MGDVLIRLDEVSIGYGRPLMRPIDLEIRRGEFWGVVGPNGAGKTTLARTILGLLDPVGGRVDVRAKGLRYSYTPQRHRLSASYPVSAFEVVLMGRTAYLPVGRRPGPDDRKRATEELARLDMAEHGKALFRSLSGGQQQRVLFARALAVDPDVLVLDEPAEGMDLLGTSDILRFLRRLNADGRMAVLMISHRIDHVIDTVDHLCIINKDSDTFEAGPVATIASPERLSSLYGRPITTRVHDGRTHVELKEV
ncbi:MAG: metal ABC transporter ATP-binding protein [Deltaproteobacteria bacterium]|nr:metal ABC transporter ATP-binding protein [Deltaproteobacteria bacterium]